MLYVQDKDSEMKEEKMAENMQKSLYFIYFYKLKCRIYALKFSQSISGLTGVLNTALKVFKNLYKTIFMIIFYLFCM